MKRTKSVYSLLAALCAARIAMAQDTPSVANNSPKDTQDVNDKAIELSPFTVTASQDKGYMVTNSASGTRIALPL